ncbi:MAG: outer membrane protein transport protein, partial [Clostridia bacterium]|nr:outer membrane protein transport protein [Clostridia bacterium]
MNLFRKGALTVCALLSLSFALPQHASAEGFATTLEASARGMALGGGLVARGGDPSVIAYNPAAMTRLEGTQMQGNLAITQMYWGVDYKVKFTGKKGNAHSSHQTWPIPSWYITHQYNDQLWLGVGQLTRFGLGVKYPNNWVGGANLQAVKLITSSITPNI